MSSSRSAFSLIEVLVVLAIIGILTSLLLPAVQNVRESARQKQCENRLSQIGMALQSYHASHKCFPFGMGGTGDRYSAISQLLPYLDQPTVHDDIDFRLPAHHPENDEARLVELAILRCPSDFANRQPESGGAINYYTNKGSKIQWRDKGQNGLFVFQTFLAYRDIIDGKSHTAAFSERVLTDGNNGQLSPFSDVFSAPGDPETPDEAIELCNSVDIEDLSAQFPALMGAPWIDGRHGYMHVNLPNRRSCGFRQSLEATMPPSSRHPDGVYLLMADGAVRFVTDDLDLGIWRALGSRNGRDVTGEF